MLEEKSHGGYKHGPGIRPYDSGALRNLLEYIGFRNSPREPHIIHCWWNFDLRACVIIFVAVFWHYLQYLKLFWCKLKLKFFSFVVPAMFLRGGDMK